MSQLGQVGILPVIQLLARNAQVEPQPQRVGIHVARPSDFVVAFLPTGTLPTGEKVEVINRQNWPIKVTVKLKFSGFDSGWL